MKYNVEIIAILSVTVIVCYKVPPQYVGWFMIPCCRDSGLISSTPFPL